MKEARSKKKGEKGSRGRGAKKKPLRHEPVSGSAFFLR
jgi:hypothetical protein